MAFRSFNKVTNSLLCEIPFDSQFVLKEKLFEMRRAQDIISRFSAADKMHQINHLVSIISKNKNQLEGLLTLELGKYKEQSVQEIEKVVDTLKLCQEERFFKNSARHVNSNLVQASIHYNSLGLIFNVLSDYQPLWTTSIVCASNIL